MDYFYKNMEKITKSTRKAKTSQSFDTSNKNKLSYNQGTE